MFNKPVIYLCYFDKLGILLLIVMITHSVRKSSCYRLALSNRTCRDDWISHSIQYSPICHVLLLNTWNVVSVNEDLNFKFIYLKKF